MCWWELQKVMGDKDVGLDVGGLYGLFGVLDGV